jgi:thiol:disulfide interchange protein
MLLSLLRKHLIRYLCWGVLSLPAFALAHDHVNGDAASVQVTYPQLILSASHKSTTTHKATAQIAFTVTMALAEGWHIGAEKPGATGMPTRVLVSASPLISNVHLHWPEPKLHIDDGKKNWFYEGNFSIHGTATTALADTPEAINIEVHYALCKEVCLPQHDTLLLPLNAIARSETTDLAMMTHHWPSLRTLLFMWLAAYMGGFVLNAMPCVLPVLSLKLLQILHHQGYKPREARRAMLGVSSGIILTFLGIGTLLALARTAGEQVGFGFHFQQPGFIAFILVVVLMMAWQLFTDRTLGISMRWIPWLNQWWHHHPQLGPVLQGVFSTLLATPCSAPYLGTAMGFALSQPYPIILLLFMGMGIGMATPYLAIAAHPGLLRYLPRSGAWMQYFRKVTGLLLFATALWLGWILWSQLQPYAKATVYWQPLEETRIGELVAQGKTVVVDVTANWCTTCKLNQLLVFDRPITKGWLALPCVHPMLGDITNANPAVSQYLHHRGIYAIPHAAVYGPSAPDGIILPILLNRQALFDAISVASAGACILQ